MTKPITPITDEELTRWENRVKPQPGSLNSRVFARIEADKRTVATLETAIIALKHSRDHYRDLARQRREELNNSAIENDTLIREVAALKSCGDAQQEADELRVEIEAHVAEAAEQLRMLNRSRDRVDRLEDMLSEIRGVLT